MFEAVGAWFAERGTFLEWFAALGAWAAGLGALAAAGVALYLAYSDRKIDIIGICDVGVVVIPPLPDLPPVVIRGPVASSDSVASGDSVMPGASVQKVLYISATNVGFRGVTIDGISLRIKKRIFAKRTKDEPKYELMKPSIPGTSQIPLTLTEGKSAKWLYEMNHIKNELITKKPDVAGTPIVSSKKDAKSLVCELRTNHRKNIVIRPDRKQIDLIIAALDKHGKV